MSSDLYSRLVDDTGFFRRVEAEYCRDDDLLDVAWWLEHPNKDTPAGRLAPTHAIRALQHQLYARSTSEEDRQEAAEAIRELQENVAASQAQLIEAVAKAEARWRVGKCATRGQGGPSEEMVASGCCRGSRGNRDDRVRRRTGSRGLGRRGDQLAAVRVAIEAGTRDRRFRATPGGRGPSGMDPARFRKRHLSPPEPGRGWRGRGVHRS